MRSFRKGHDVRREPRAENAPLKGRGHREKKGSGKERKREEGEAAVGKAETTGNVSSCGKEGHGRLQGQEVQVKGVRQSKYGMRINYKC